MALRLVEVILPADRVEAVRELLEDPPTVGPWHEHLDGDLVLTRFVIDADQTGEMITRFDEKFGMASKFQVLILPVSATLPRLEMPEPNSDEDADQSDEGSDASTTTTATTKRSGFFGTGLSHEELYEQVTDMMRLSRVYVAMVLLSGLVAALGMMRDNVAVIIGAMVIAPLLGPNVALAFSATVGDTPLLKRTLVTNAVGISLSLALAAVCGVILTVDPATTQIAMRTNVALSDIALALASGSAGALAITTGVPAALVGVMVAVALLPPTVAVGLMLGSGHFALAGGAAMLLAVNVICVNLAGVVTFLAQGIRPRVWWEAARARRSARLALIFWFGALVLVGSAIMLWQARGGG